MQHNHPQNPKNFHFQVPWTVRPPVTRDEAARSPDHGQSRKEWRKNLKTVVILDLAEYTADSIWGNSQLLLQVAQCLIQRCSGAMLKKKLGKGKTRVFPPICPENIEMHCTVDRYITLQHMHAHVKHFQTDKHENGRRVPIKSIYNPCTQVRARQSPVQADDEAEHQGRDPEEAQLWHGPLLAERLHHTVARHQELDQKGKPPSPKPLSDSHWNNFSLKTSWPLHLIY